MEPYKKLSRPAGGVKADEMVAALIAEMMNASTVAHKLHLKVKGVGSYAQHMALGSFYDDVKDLADSLAEQYQGHKLILLNIGEAPMKNFVMNDVDDCLEYLEKFYNLISEVQSVMTCSSIINEMDNIKSLTNTTKYKLKFLS